MSFEKDKAESAGRKQKYRQVQGERKQEFSWEGEGTSKDLRTWARGFLTGDRLAV